MMIIVLPQMKKLLISLIVTLATSINESINLLLMKKNLLFFILASLGVFQFSCLNTEHPFGKIKEIVIIKRAPVSETKDEFKIQKTDAIEIIDDISDLEFVREIRRRFEISIAEKTFLGLLVSDKNDTSFVNIQIPGGTIVDFNTKRKYEVLNEEYQERLQSLFIAE